MKHRVIESSDSPPTELGKVVTLTGCLQPTANRKTLIDQRHAPIVTTSRKVRDKARLYFLNIDAYGA